MGVNALNLVLGPARLYVNSFGAAEPADSAVTPNGYLTPPGGSWVDVGATDGGVNLEVDLTYTGLTADQVIMELGARLTDLKASVTAKLSEMTLNNLNTALNSILSLGSGSGYQTGDLNVGTPATQPSYAALCIDGWAPMTAAGTPALGRRIVRKVLSQTKVAETFDKKSQAGYECSWQVYYISPSLAPIHWVNETS